jgi:hypothetical protein
MCEILTRNDKDSGDDKSSETSSSADDEVAVAVGDAKGEQGVGTDNAFLNVLNIFIRSFEAAAKLLLELK